ncbi:ComEC/Rec2 family competence protein [Haloarchaeobius amylolyticus]|uniref:ComEC/Rec2 family competence protein n=1 Tax=Haloarchaeobius amylolyticus TaxID=1198296 RepID=UPI0022703ED0|nr:hypothetical protein [Haloarchaeobius amylolyticus]
MSETIEAHILNVGLGSSNLFVCPDGDVGVIDIEGGSLGKRISRSATQYLKKYITEVVKINSASTEIPKLFGTHSDIDHFGHTELLEQLPIQSVYFPTQIRTKNQVSRGIADTLDEVMAAGYSPRKLSNTYSEDLLPDSNAKMYAVSPPSNPSSPVNKNDNSLCLIFSYEEKTILFPGDIEERGVDWVTSDTRTKGIDCLVAPHHGSGTVDYSSLLEHCDPDYIFVSSAHEYHDKRYDHPSRKFLNDAKRYGCEVFWTAVHGNIVATTDGSEWRVKSQQNYSTDPDKLGDCAVDEADLCAFDDALVSGYPESF